MRLLKPGLVILSLAFFLSACADTKPVNTAAPANVAQTPLKPLPTATIDELASGRKVYEQNCAACHRADGTGGKIEIDGAKLNPEDLTTPKISKFSDEKLIGYVVNGIEDEGMPAFKGKLSEGEIRDVVKFIRTEFHKN